VQEHRQWTRTLTHHLKPREWEQVIEARPIEEFTAQLQYPWSSTES
jgi:hypothetical protein